MNGVVPLKWLQPQPLHLGIEGVGGWRASAIKFSQDGIWITVYLPVHALLCDRCKCLAEFGYWSRGLRNEDSCSTHRLPLHIYAVPFLFPCSALLEYMTIPITLQERIS